MLCVLLSATLWGLIWYPLRLLAQAGLPATWSTFTMYLATALLTVPYFYRQRGRGMLTGPLFVLALAAGVTNVAFIVALADGEVMRVMLLFYLSPLWTVVMGWVWLHERISIRAIMMLLLAMGGAVVMLWNPEIGQPWPASRADWLALIAGMAFSVNNVVTRQLNRVEMIRKTGVSWWGVVVVSALVLFWQSAPIPQVSGIVWVSAWLLGWLGIVMMTVMVFYGVGKLPVYRSAVIMLFELVVAAISSAWLTDEVMTLQEWLGGASILIAGYGVAHSQKG